MTIIAINGLGRIGRATLKIILDPPELELTAINDMAPVETLAYPLAYDTVYGRCHQAVRGGDCILQIGGREIPVLSERDPADLPWRERGVEVVLECTGLFLKMQDLQKHVDAGARHVVLSAPSESGETTTIHAYTTSQNIVDGPSKKLRRGRAGAANLVPTSAGAAIATTKVLSGFAGRFDGVAIRAPIPCGSTADLAFVTEKSTSVEEINRIFTEESETARYRDVLGVTHDPIVSSDILRDPRASVVDLEMTKVIDGDPVKVMSWHDNEWGHAAQMAREAVMIAKSD